ncbi:MAG: ABC transporter ATP-binding protein [Chloroflexales bacterium]|nr:ABC transporter ATP-binding protein [Chloroflexales bacterium]
MTYAIRAQGLAKLYHIGQLKEKASYGTLRDTLAGMIRRPFGQRRLPEKELWALSDISFDVRPGEVVGVIGRNGAGKSTLLKVLSRITEPSRGRAELYGRVASLLEVGTGFHPELTGRENVFLNGAILGMRRREIERNFDEIVAFAEVEKFIDTPVKYYSSGMYVRLAFAVAAHLEPEILIVDEVLAVGDSRFQKKCINKMQDVGQAGRTVLFVSHSMQSIMRMCDRTILLEFGRVIDDGPSYKVINTYLGRDTGSMGQREWPDESKSPAGSVSRLRAVRVRDEAGAVTDTIDIRRPMCLEMEYDVFAGKHVLLPHFYLMNEDNVCLFTTLDVDPEWRQRPRPPGRYISRVEVPGNLFSEGTIYVDVAITSIEPSVGQFHERDAVAFQVVDRMESDAARGDWGGNVIGLMRPMLNWSTSYTPL